MYTSYLNFLKDDKFDINNFKSNHNYTPILEHVSLLFGVQYLQLIKKEFPNVSDESICEFIQLNDKIGNPKKYKINKQISGSPTSLRYIYHALIILDYYKQTGCKNMVEVGCGYGGLFLAINYFSKLLKIEIENYHLVDLPEVCSLIEKYLSLHHQVNDIKYTLHSANDYGSDVNDQNLFFISNYCYTEIEKVHNEQYTSILLPKTQNGFIVWQDGGGGDVANSIEQCDKITNKKILNRVEERPQTNTAYKNYFVYF